MKISVRDYRGLERADVELAPLALVAGRNEQGKSCLAEAARAALSGVPVPIPGIAKKDAKLLVRDGADEGSATVSDDTGSVAVRWPKADVQTDNAGETWCSPYAVGLKHLLDLDDKERASVLSGYINSVPDSADLATAMQDAGYGEKAIDQVWKSVTGSDGWDGTHKKAREHGTKLKGQWEAVAGEKYGAKKAETWAPAGLPDAASREDLEADLERAKAAVKKAIGSAAVSAAEVERLRAEAEAEPEGDTDALAKDIEDLRSELAEAESERLALPAEDTGSNTVCKCPACEADLVVEHVWNGPTVLKLHNEEMAKQAASKEVRKQRAALDGRISNLQGRISTISQQIARIEQQRERIEQARKRLDEIGEQPADAGDGVAEAEQAEATAKAALDAFDAKARADKLHAEIGKNEKLVEILASDGLRKRKLAAGLEAMNGRLAELSAAAKWPTVRLDENLQAHYGTRPLWAASKSGQWRARLVVQIAMAQIDGSAAVVIDEADILDARGRNGMMALLQATGIKALVCMTINKPELVPDLEKAGLGQSYWLEAGIVTPIENQAVQQAA